MNMFKLDAEYFDAVKVISPTKTFSDDRGCFSVAFRKDNFRDLGLPDDFVQDNVSISKKNVLRGLHFQAGIDVGKFFSPIPGMGKLMTVTRGRALLVAVDFRPNSETYLQYVTTYATAQNRRQVWAPADFLRGFLSLKDDTEVRYKCDNYFNAEQDRAIRWDDLEIGVNWPITNPILSQRDKNAPTVAEYLEMTGYGNR